MRQPTIEQQRILDAALTGEDLVVDALAGTGKGVTLDTLIPTPGRGLVAAGDIRVGDYIFTASGAPTKVRFVSEVSVRPTYRMTFNDGVSVVVDDEHRWLTSRVRSVWGAWQVRTTKELVEAGVEHGVHARRQFSIPVALPVNYPTKSLPIDPYLLGVWLGDGSSAGGEVTNSEADIQERLARDFKARVRTNKGRAPTIIVPRLHTQLRDLGVLKNKHIPQEYLTASAGQRLELIRGLMDTDGHVSGGYEFCSTNLSLAEGFRQLIHSMGAVATLRSKRAKLHGRDYGELYTVAFSTARFVPVSSAKHLGKPLPKGRLDGRRYIIGIEPLGPNSTVCFQVDDPSELFLVGDSYIVTHNTSVLQMISEARPDRMLYLAYNKRMAVEAEGKFGRHVSVMTTHALAYRAVGHKYRHKLNRPQGGYVNVSGTGGEVARTLDISSTAVDGRTIGAPTIGYAILNTLKHFENSADPELTGWHVSMGELVSRGISRSSTNADRYREMILGFAKELWAKRIDLSDATLATHDTYLKLFQLSKPTLEYDIVLLDEAQDSNPCLLNIVLSQKGKQIIVVGDELQSIYQWRGSINALAQLPWRRERLTKSFRFGNELAELARHIILDDHMQPFLSFTGNEKLTTSITPHIGSTQGVTHIHRTNAALLVAALEKIEAGHSVEISIDIAPFRRKLDSAMALYEGRTRDIKHPDVMLFESWDEFVEDGELRDPENRHIAAVVKAGLYNRVTELLGDYRVPAKPDYLFVTAHKSKGLEWPHVVLGDDFNTVERSKETGQWRFVSEGERNLLYVAVTRAQETLVPNSEVELVRNIGAQAMLSAGG